MRILFILTLLIHSKASRAAEGNSPPPNTKSFRILCSQIAITTFYNNIASKYNVHFSERNEDYQYIAKFALSLPQDGKFLDAGAGNGRFTPTLFFRSKNVEAVDLSEQMVELGRKLVPEAKWAVMDLTKMEYPDSQFDGVLAAYSIIHLTNENVAKSLEEFARVLRPGGKLLLVVQAGDVPQRTASPIDGREIFVNLQNRITLEAILNPLGLFVTETETRDHIPGDELPFMKLYLTVEKKLD